MEPSTLEHIGTQALTVARYLQSENAVRGLIKNSFREHPQAIPESLEWFDSMMAGLTKEQIGKWMQQGYNLFMDGVPHKTFGDLWEFLDRLDEEGDNVIVLEEAAQWSDAELAGFWDAQWHKKSPSHLA
ncbi:hypothetical protein [Sphingobacterium bambusae]|uniref:Uncharacterized protein n=1 Tax=Sphingobacterium bambusae TaxID=662858 RepID=A0ABW6BGA4_9SPHI|nr:hypothetical protein [Sphingobacterium bambusae]WPL49683.1 hypothetical protein SCB77_04360 [Sphingobacterium bambusae]